jgi:hypothetical protein
MSALKNAGIKIPGRINTLFSLFHQEKKDINDADQLWGIRNLTDFRRQTQCCLSSHLSFLPSFSHQVKPTTAR